MEKNNFFFRREEFSRYDIKRPYYTYLGYFLVEDSEKDTYKRYPKRYPLSIYFGKDEIAVYYTNDDNLIFKIFYLYVAEGEVNQIMLAKKVEDYALMPLWPLSENLLKEEIGIYETPEESLKNNSGRLCIDPLDLQIGYFSYYYGFKLSDGRFLDINLPGSRSNVVMIENEKNLRFKYEARTGKDLREDKWELKEEKIKVTKINFSKLLLDFLFELDFANTFEDENFFHLQPHIRNNLALDALTKKCKYLMQLSRIKNDKQETQKPRLSKSFQVAEKEWLNVCRLERYKPVFASPHSLFDLPELEVTNCFLRAKIGEGRKKRRKYLMRKEDADLRNEISTFFMAKYDILSAFRILMPEWAIVLLGIAFIAIPLGDYALCDSNSWYICGLSSTVLPIAILFFLAAYYWTKKINLFKLLLPRLFLGIMLGWSIFWSTEELWKEAVIANTRKIVVVNIVLFVILFLYIFTDIRNKLFRVPDSTVRIRAFGIIFLAMLISFVQGFYVIQFKAKPMIENSGFLETMSGEEKPSIDMSLGNQNADSQADYSKYKGNLFGFRNFRSVKLFFSNECHFRYIWSVHLSQFMMSILIGVVLQLLWEDRPITQPL
jgi:hypothetical protein